VFVYSIGTYVDPAAAPPGPTPSQTSREDARHRDGVEAALLDARVPPPLPAPVPPPEPADALGVEEDSEPAINAAPAASAITAAAPISRLPVMPTPREVERIPWSHRTAGPSRIDVDHVTAG